MLEANKSVWFEKIFAMYNRNLLKRRFQALRVEGIENLQKFPMVIYCNHSSWWDGLVAFEISRKAKLDSFLMMEEKQLKNLPLFRRVGAFSVIRESPRDAVKSINYAVNLLKEKQDRAIWMFPQGEILPNDIRPLEFYNGISRLIEKAGNCYAVPVAIRYEFLGDWKPEVFVKIGEIEQIEEDKSRNSKQLTKHFAGRLTKTLEALKIETICKTFANYKNLI